jgi:hypothetical protein
MILGGKWVGLGLGDVSPEVRKIKEFMRKKFRSYAGHLADTELYDEAMTAAVLEMQRRYRDDGKLAPDLVNGIVGATTKYVMGYLPWPATPKRGTFLTVCGTGVPWWVGPDADTARAVADQWLWQPVGYPAAPFPMNPSVQNGRAELINQINLHPGPIALGGYSQGAIVTAEVWEYDIKPSNGRLHHRINDVKKAVAWGNPMRQQGKSHPDPGAGMAGPKSEGIADRLMVDTPDWWRNYAHAGDLYTDVEGDSGEMKRSIYKVVMGTRVFSGPDSLLSQVLEITTSPLFETIAMFKAMMDAGMFFAKGTGPHVNYNVGPAIDYLRAS